MSAATTLLCQLSCGDSRRLINIDNYGREQEVDCPWCHAKDDCGVCLADNTFYCFRCEKGGESRLCAGWGPEGGNYEPAAIKRLVGAMGVNYDRICASLIRETRAAIAAYGYTRVYCAVACEVFPDDVGEDSERAAQWLEDKTDVDE